MYKQVLPHCFCHSRLLKHYTSFEMYYIKVMINFTQNNHFFLYYAYHYLPLPIFFTWQKANPSIKAIHTCLEFLPTLLRNRAKLNSFFFYVIHFRADLQIDIFPIFSFRGALHSFLDQFILYIPSACLFQQQSYCLQTNNALVCKKKYRINSTQIVKHEVNIRGTVVRITHSFWK